ncbi:GGDEF domain-containing protein [Bacillus sp. SCS-151]|uniref:GGDEF domain-containing protein n=1 Tax=Nanhaiella sioensis TaxID=3115293 RepID=UPI00397B12BA
MKAFLVGILLFIALLCINYLSTPSPALLIEIFAIILPLNIAIVALIKDGAVFSIQGRIMSIILLLEAAIFVWLFRNRGEQAFRFILDYELPISNFNYENMPQLSIVLFLLLLSTLIIINIVNYSVENTFLLGISICLFLAFHFQDRVLNLEIFFSLSGLLLILSIINRTYSMAYIDELTRIPSRRMLREDLMKLGGKYSIAMLDIDFFKKFNDKYGHDVGDEVLKLVASCLQKVTGNGKAYRYGGEEFTIIFPRKDIKEVIPHLDELRKKISKQEYAYKKQYKNGKSTTQKLKVTISIGVAQRNETNKATDEVIKAADKALYRAKKKGRNCVSK